MSLKEKPYKGGRKFKFMSRRKTQRENFYRDSGDLVQTTIIIAAMVVASIVVVGGISSVTQSKGKSTAECINNATNFGQGAVVRENCKKTDEEAQEKGEEAIVGNFGEGRNEPEEEEEELITSTSDTCFLLNENGDTIVKYKIELEECSTDVVIPKSISNITIKHVGDYAFINETGLTIEDISFGITSVKFPNTIETIGLGAFAYNNITNITIPDLVTSISEFTFSNNQLTSVNIPDSVTSIEQYAFTDNEIANLYIPDSVESIGKEAFYNNPLQSLRITENPNYTTIENRTFSFFCGVTGGCTGKPNTTNINLLEIPNNIKTIESRAFDNMQIRELTIPSSVETIKDYAFRRAGVERVNFNDGLISIGSRSFYANNLEELVLPETLQIIESNAFAYNRSLLNNNDLVIPYSVKEIGAGAFVETGLNYRNPPTVMIPHHTNYHSGNGNLKSFNESFVNIVRY